MLTRQQIIDAAEAASYDTSSKTDEELLNDIAFYKAAFGTDSVVKTQYINSCPCGRGHVMESKTPAWVIAFSNAVAHVEAGDLTTAWSVMGQDRPTSLKNEDGSINMEEAFKRLPAALVNNGFISN